jgi:tripartite-type tricarboxylate transporter receptor subunit TctC
MNRRTILTMAATAFGCATTGLPALGQTYPSRPVRLVVGFAAGGPTDVIARLLAPGLGTHLGQPVVVENRTGANGLIATEAVARAASDGYTLQLATLSHNVNPLLMRQASYHPLRDFAPVGLVATLPLIIVCAVNAPYRSVADLVAAAKASPGAVTYGSAGHGGSAHLAGALLANLSDTEMTHVPFRGNAPALSEVMSGRVSFMFYTMIGIADLVMQGQLRPLAVSTAQRHPDFPGVPTLAEVGFSGFEDYDQGLGILAPARTPEPVVGRLSEALRATLAQPEVREGLRGLGAVVTTSTPAEYADFLRQDASRWERLIKAANIEAQN